MDEVPSVEIFKPILIRVVSVGATVEIMSRRVFNSILVTGILQESQNTCNNKEQGTYLVLLLVVHERSNGSASVGMITGLTTNTDGGTANAKMINSTGNSARGRGHCINDE